MFLRLWLFAVALLVGLVSSLPADEYRTWSDVSGKFTVQARLVRIEENYAILEREDGVKVAVEISKLSPADRQYIERNLPENPFIVIEDKSAKKLELPAAPSTSAEEPLAGTGFRPYFIEHANTGVAIDWSKVKPIPIDPSVDWTLTVPYAKPITRKVQSFGLPAKIDMFEKVTALVTHPLANSVVVQYTATRPGRQEKSHRFVFCDLERQKVAATPPGSKDSSALAIYPSSVSNEFFFVCRQDKFGFGNRDVLSINSPMASGDPSAPFLRVWFTWTPYETMTGAARDVKWADFPNERTLVTCSGTGLILIWNLANMQPEASLQTTMGHVPALSPNCQWLAFATRDQVGILDIETRRIVALQNTPRPQAFPILAFSPSGKKLACLTNQRMISVWDVASGKLEADFSLPSGIVFGEKFLFPHDDFILGGDRYLLHWKSQLLVWDYKNIEAAAMLGDLTCIVFSQSSAAGVGNVSCLGLTHIPHAAALQVLETALKKPETFAFRAGVPVKLDVSAIPEDAQDDVRKTLAERLKQMDCEIQETADITVAAGASGPKERTVSYWHSGDYKVKEYHVWLKILAGDQVLWETSAGGVPFILFLKPGENVGQKLRELTGKPNYDWFSTVALPRFLQHAPAKGSLALGSGPIVIDHQ